LSYSGFLRLMHKDLVVKQNDNKRQIIRFTCKKEFNSCISQIKKLKTSLFKLRYVQPIQSINAICCSLRTSNKLLKHRGILFIEEDIKIKVHHFPGLFLPYFQQGTIQDVPTIPWGLQKIEAPQAWKKSSGKRVKIGVVDTGADFSHPDLRSSLAGGVNFIQRNRPAYDDNGHGTHIAGTIAADNKSGGIMGVAPKSSIYAVKSFDKNGSAFVSDIILGIDWCVRHKMDIINMSFGMKNRSLSLRDSIRNAYNAGVIVVASSGNDGKASNIDYPARFIQTIAVGATDKNRQIASFSNRGKGISIYAPGDKIYSTWLNNGYNTISGTSMATSHISGIVALLLSLSPGLSTNRIKSLLKKSALPLKKKRKNAASIGEANAYKAIQPYVKKRIGRG
jgi:subtilisin